MENRPRNLNYCEVFYFDTEVSLVVPKNATWTRNEHISGLGTRFHIFPAEIKFTTFETFWQIYETLCVWKFISKLVLLWSEFSGGCVRNVLETWDTRFISFVFLSLNHEEYNSFVIPSCFPWFLVNPISLSWVFVIKFFKNSMFLQYLPPVLTRNIFFSGSWDYFSKGEFRCFSCSPFSFNFVIHSMVFSGTIFSSSS